MNLQLLLFALLGLVVGIGIVASRKGIPHVYSGTAWVKYALVVLVMLALVYWYDTHVVRTILTACTACGLVLLVDNNLQSKK
jgi:hypothetical protein